MTDPAKQAAIEQCERDIAKLQEELKRLKDAASPRPRHGDIVRWKNSPSVDARDSIRIVFVDANGVRVYDRHGNNMIAADYADGNGAALFNYATGRYTVIGNVFDLDPAMLRGA